MCQFSNLMKRRVGCASIAMTFFALALPTFRATGPRRCLLFVQLAPLDLNWTVGLDEFEELLASERESAPGPDGLPYSVYRSAGGFGAQFSLRCQACLQRAALPSRTVFIPKSTEIDAQGHITRSLEALRPLTLSLPCVPAYEDTPPSAITLLRDASLTVS